MYRWYIALTHLRAFEGEIKISNNDTALVSSLLITRDKLMMDDLKEVAYEVALQLLFRNMGKAVSNIVSTQISN
jgi:hypothetical protein